MLISCVIIRHIYAYIPIAWWIYSNIFRVLVQVLIYFCQLGPIIGGMHCMTWRLSITSRHYVQPVFLSTPIHLGGLGLPLPSIGTLLSVQRMSKYFFAQIHNHWGSNKNNSLNYCRDLRLGLLSVSVPFTIYKPLFFVTSWMF
jgi:hypothetical protein